MRELIKQNGLKLPLMGKRRQEKCKTLKNEIQKQWNGERVTFG